MLAMILCIGVTGTLIIKAVQLSYSEIQVLPIETNEIRKSDDSSEPGSMVKRFSAKRQLWDRQMPVYFLCVGNEGLRHAKADVQCLDLKCYKKVGRCQLCQCCLFFEIKALCNAT